MADRKSDYLHGGLGKQIRGNQFLFYLGPLFGIFFFFFFTAFLLENFPGGEECTKSSPPGAL